MELAEATSTEGVLRSFEGKLKSSVEDLSLESLIQLDLDQEASEICESKTEFSMPYALLN